ncbi:MAG: hypothetical protein KGM17_04510 [Sphingomonadales bacterium]|nr:hypothetical protein [Sphingomonadales bacterium]
MLFYLPLCWMNFHKPRRSSVHNAGAALVGRCTWCGKRVVRVGPKRWKLRVARGSQVRGVSQRRRDAAEYVEHLLSGTVSPPRQELFDAMWEAGYRPKTVPSSRLRHHHAPTPPAFPDEQLAP